MDSLLLRNSIQFLKCQQKIIQELQMWSNVKQKMQFQVMKQQISVAWHILFNWSSDYATELQTNFVGGNTKEA